ncbi:hypothetical protein HCN44_007427 [Aphidius gifuensis]|uniref:Uncharacterized protein n=1 Tax=Aphidius gifuensis TaxID=684658 RepID=A0A835CMB4_APHGI|nr:hypothetical protein HCN44_007427 [Aphidius gifuensis]
MSAIANIGLRLVGTAKYITNNISTKCLRSMCINGSTNNSITSAQEKSTENLKIENADKKKKFECSIIGKKIITSSVFFNWSGITIKTPEDKKSFINPHTSFIKISNELNENKTERAPAGKSPPMIKIGKFNAKLRRGELTLATQEGDKTFIFSHGLYLGVKKSTKNLENEVAAKKKENETIPSKIGEFNILHDSKLTLKTSEGEKKLTTNHRFCTETGEEVTKNLQNGIAAEYVAPKKNAISPIIGNFNLSFNDRLELQKQKSDELYEVRHGLNITFDKKSNENSLNEITTKEEFPTDKTISSEINRCDVLFNSGGVLFETQNGDKILVQQILDIKIYEDGSATSIDVTPHLNILSPVEE